ncbi:hypothetical protein KPH14_009230 [Odynerus spinipes]|uniref:Uncharacterized protein n=1 Tax=Odynerus spinipes TaxID=1348599 RepID=A0AAD9RP37_9HYME|nr:hypothetical protein KPH14_009230 [Odynerus spinipes]
MKLRLAVTSHWVNYVTPHSGQVSTRCHLDPTSRTINHSNFSAPPDFFLDKKTPHPSNLPGGPCRCDRVFPTTDKLLEMRAFLNATQTNCRRASI